MYLQRFVPMIRFGLCFRQREGEMSCPGPPSCASAPKARTKPASFHEKTNGLTDCGKAWENHMLFGQMGFLDYRGPQKVISNFNNNNVRFMSRYVNASSSPVVIVID